MITREDQDGGRRWLQNDVGTFRVEVDLAPLRLSIQAPALGLQLQGCGIAATLSGLRVQAERAEVIESDATRSLRLVSQAQAGIEFEVELEVASARPEVEICVRLRNGAAAELVLTSIDSLFCDPAQSGRRELAGQSLQMFQQGYHSGSLARYTGLEDQNRDARDAEHTGPETPDGSRELLVSDAVTQLAAPDGPVVAVGFISHRERHTHVGVRHQGRQPTGFRACSELSGHTLAPGQQVAAERLWLALLPPQSDGIAHWADRAAECLRARATETARLGPEKRGSLGSVPNAQDPLATLRVPTPLPLAKRSWAELKEWASALTRQNVRACARFAPFLLPEGSELAGRHREWLLRDDKGKIRRLTYGGSTHVVLDPGHSKVQAWLRELATRMKRSGIRTLELEMLRVATLPGPDRRERESAIQAYRHCLGVLRDTLGDGAYLIGADAPIGPSIGVLDAVRFGSDANAGARPPLLGRWFQRSRVRAARSTPLLRANLHRRLWCNEWESASPSGSAENLFGRAVYAASADTRSDTHSWPCTGAKAEVVARSGATAAASVVQRWPDGSTLLLAANPSAHPRSLGIELALLGLEGPVNVYSVDEARMLPECMIRLATGLIPAGGFALFRITPKSDQPQILGSTLHYTAGALGTQLEAEGTALRLSAQLPGRRQGSIWFSDTRGHVSRVELGFDDAIGVEIPACEGGPWGR